MGVVADAILAKNPNTTVGTLEPAVISAKAERQNKGNQLAGSPVKPKTYADIYQMLNADKPLTPAEQAAEARRQKSNERMSAIGDAIGAIANMWGTAHGAQNAVDPQQTMSTRTQAYWDKLNKERRENSQRYLAGYLQARQLDMQQQNLDGANQLDREKYNEAVRQFWTNFDYKKGRDAVADSQWNKEFGVKKQNSDASVAHQQNVDALGWANNQLARDRFDAQNNTTVDLGDGVYTLGGANFNEGNISNVFYALGDEITKNYTKDATGRTIVPTDKVMKAVISANAAKSPEAAALIRKYAGAAQGRGEGAVQGQAGAAAPGTLEQVPGFGGRP